jgi:threonyl-tRNA synthetase
MINITLPDNSVRQYPEGTTGMEIAKSISEGLARNVLSVLVNEEVWDATRPILTDAKINVADLER